MTVKMIPEVERLFAHGLAIHWLHEKEKRPIGNNWASGPRKTLEALKAGYREGLNVGVRLGTPSKVTGGYLAVIDVDVKGETDHHRLEAEARLDSFFPGWRAAPQVATGRGNGSCHIYVRTKEPAAPRRVCQSAGKVKVKMPSAKPSGFEQGELKPEELKAGIRIRPAWEISVMGEGQQVVLPPSFHPDTGRQYSWRQTLGRPEAIPFLAADVMGKKKPDLIPTADFKVVAYDLDRLDDDIRALILFSDGSGDGSLDLKHATEAMVRAGYSDPEILTALTDADNSVSEAVYRRRRARASAAQWIAQYQLGGAREQFRPAREVFEEADKVAGKKPEEPDWRAGIKRNTNNNVIASTENLAAIINGDLGPDIFKLNKFSSFEEFGRSSPWGGRVGEEVTQGDVLELKAWFAKWGVDPAKDKLFDLLELLARRNPYHPVREYLEALEWDGVPRVDTWLQTYCNAAGPEKYVRAISRKFLVAMVKRVMEPGCKFDHMLILEGGQGNLKSTALRALAGKTWFSDAHVDVHQKDGVLLAQAVWLLEFGELASLNHADTSRIKSFITTQVDRIRRPYGRRVETFPRQVVFVGTVNEAHYLKDGTGGRRFWPVKVRDCDGAGIARDRDQLFAEAMLYYGVGEDLYLDRETEALAQGEQAQRTHVDMWVDILRDGIKAARAAPDNERKFDPGAIKMTDLFKSDGPLGNWKAGKGEQMRAAEALHALKYSRKRISNNKGTERAWAYVPT